ncbi:unnamed protein product [Orchesella dallaii]|uniref:Uncharacterized protein n=1 Tax=Orchesella dallaii TaxID=48710 RepID=A0ABP1QFB5_9HEXA
MYCPSQSVSYCTPYPSHVNCCPPYPPCPPPSSQGSNGCCGVSKLANFVHYGGRCGNATERPCGSPQVTKCCQPQCEQKSAKPAVRRCPPLPPCAATCITPNCKDMPAQRLRNVDVLEELCYYVPGSDPNCAMDCYTVDCCGNVEKISEADACGCNPDCCAPNPVKYSRRQRFTFNDNDGRSNTDPWPFDGSCGGAGASNGRRASNCGHGDGAPKNTCCGGGGGSGRQYTYCPEEPIDCSDMLPPDSGVYYFDRDRRAFVPEKDLPKPPAVIEREVKVPDVEEYEFLEEENPCPPPQKPTIQPVVQPIIMPGGGGPICPPPCNPCPPQPPQYSQCPPQYNPCPPQCNPCPPQCNPCAPQCNPCAQQCNPCGNSCAPCCNPCNPCCNPCNPCMPCGPMNPFMNMCGGVLPMVIPMCPQQPASFGGGPLPPPPPFPFPPPFLGKKKKKKKSSKKTSYYDDESEGYSENIIVPGAPEEVFDRAGGVPPDARGASIADTIEVEEEDELPNFDEGGNGPGPGAQGGYGPDGGYNAGPNGGGGPNNGGGYGAAPSSGGGYGGAPSRGGGYGGGPNNGGNNGGGPNNSGNNGGGPNNGGNNGGGPNTGGRYGGGPNGGGGYGGGPNGGGPNENGGYGGNRRGNHGRPDHGRGNGPGSSRGYNGDIGVGRNGRQGGTLITTIDFPPGHAEDVSITATDRKNANSKMSNIDIVAEFKGNKGKGGPYPTGHKLTPHSQYEKGGTAVKSYKMPQGKDGFIKASHY